LTTVWLARHGEVDNPGNVLYGRLPRVRMTPEGWRQAEALAARLASRDLAAIYSSPMLRARATAQVILAQHPELGKIKLASDLHEIRSGWQGEPLAALERIDWDLYGHPRRDDDESLQMISARMMRWLQRVLRRHAGGEVVGVSHGDPILILVGTLRGLPLQPHRIFPRPYIATGSMYRLQFGTNFVCQDIELLVPHAEAAA
jgi:broad specificity phosphatase PhoE